MNKRRDSGPDILHIFADPVSTRCVLCLDPQLDFFLVWWEEGRLPICNTLRPVSQWAPSERRKSKEYTLQSYLHNFHQNLLKPFCHM